MTPTHRFELYVTVSTRLVTVHFHEATGRSTPARGAAKHELNKEFRNHQEVGQYR